MLLNNFLYQRSLIKNELYKERNNFSIIVPKSSFNNIFIELFDFEKKEHKEETKEVIVRKGGNRLTDLGVSWANAASEDMKQRVERSDPEELPDDMSKDNILTEELPDDMLTDDMLTDDMLTDDMLTDDEEEQFYETKEDFTKDIVFDNLKPADGLKGGGKDIKNVVVSFF